MQGPIPPAIPIVNLAPASFVPFHTCSSSSLWAPGLARPSKLHCFRTAAHPWLFPCSFNPGMIVLIFQSFRSQSFSKMLSTVLLILVFFCCYFKITDLKVFPNVVNGSFNPGGNFAIHRLPISCCVQLLWLQGWFYFQLFGLLFVCLFVWLFVCVMFLTSKDSRLRATALTVRLVGFVWAFWGFYWFYWLFVCSLAGCSSSCYLLLISWWLSKTAHWL